jgi:hypothetical protein
MDSNFRFRAKGATDLSFRFCLCPRNRPRSNAEIHPARGPEVRNPGPARPMGRTPDHWETSSPRPNGLMARPGTESSNPSPSSGESAANFVFGREAWKGPRRRQGTDGSNPAPSRAESQTNRPLPDPRAQTGPRQGAAFASCTPISRVPGKRVPGERIPGKRIIVRPQPVDEVHHFGIAPHPARETPEIGERFHRIDVVHILLCGSLPVKCSALRIPARACRSPKRTDDLASWVSANPLDC